MTTKMRFCANAAVTLSPSFTPICSGPLQRKDSQLSTLDPAHVRGPSHRLPSPALARPVAWRAHARFL